ncbi:response regulator transcription factor [Actinoplanes bogorensis]|uniref:Response regulator transcription factor n=2 Tax=Paractinoplanes bogorensis TaxID=1610840 RepID=A0ABS5Z546_9ACTN|nr:response regulator transcription factor [Actinoplanes bogorensis]
MGAGSGVGVGAAFGIEGGAAFGVEVGAGSGVEDGAAPGPYVVAASGVGADAASGVGAGAASGVGADAASGVGAAASARGPLAARYPAEAAFAAETRAVLEGGEPLWLTAVAAWRADGHRHELACALLSLAEAQAAAGHRAEAADTIAESVAIASALGAAPLLAAADTLGRRVGVRPAAASAERDELLTAREREVLRLVAEGHSNSRIAASLYISPKTASVHVSRIIAKLQVANRGEAAAVARRLGLLND